MKSHWLAVGILLSSFLAGIAITSTFAAPAQAQPATGGVEFEAEVTPASGQAEPVRQLSFYLLRKSLIDIRKEAEQSEPPADMDKYIDGLKVSPELKAWMEKNHSVDFEGQEFNKMLTPDDVLKIPEFLEAYKNLNGALMNEALHSSVKESDRIKNPDKYKREQEKYQKALEQYVHAHPGSVDGLDAELSDVNPGRRWNQLQSEQKRSAEQRTMMLAQTQYLAAKTVSDLNGNGSFRDLPEGSYWLTALGVPALAGDMRVEWDVPVLIRPGRTATVQLSNFNALTQSDSTAH